MTDQESEVKFLQNLAGNDGRVLVLCFRILIRFVWEWWRAGTTGRRCHHHTRIMVSGDFLIAADAAAEDGRLVCADAALDRVKRRGNSCWLRVGGEEVVSDVFDKDPLALGETMDVSTCRSGTPGYDRWVCGALKMGSAKGSDDARTCHWGMAITRRQEHICM